MSFEFVDLFPFWCHYGCRYKCAQAKPILELEKLFCFARINFSKLVHIWTKSEWLRYREILFHSGELFLFLVTLGVRQLGNKAV